MKNKEKEITEGIELQNQESIKTPGEKENFKNTWEYKKRSL